MDLYINKFCTRIRKSGERIQLFFPTSQEKKEYPVRRLSKIIITRPSSISYGAVDLALNHDVDVVYLGNFGMPKGRIYPSAPRRLTLIKRKQVEKAVGSEALYLSKQFIAGKIKNQQNYLKYLAQKYPDHDFSSYITGLTGILHAINLANGTIESLRGHLMGLEGRAAEFYFGALKMIIPFERRDRHAHDLFNIFLNYAYGMLYSEIERACLLVGLDPHISFLHTERYGQLSLTFDLVEEFRVPLVDSVIVPLFEQMVVNERDVNRVNTVTLSKHGKRKIIHAVTERLYQKTEYEGRPLRVKTALLHHIRNFAHYLIGQKKEYRPFTFANF